MDGIRKFEGIVAAPFTPMFESGKINLDIIPLYYKLLERNGVAGAFINGSTGECASLTQEEKLVNIEAWAECAKKGGKVRVINLVGGTSLDECIEAAISSREAGLAAIAVLPPYYFKPANPAILAEFVSRIGEAVPEMPVYYYHIPVLTGVNFPMASFLNYISVMLPNFAGIKFTHEDLMDFMNCLNWDGGRYDILWGRDECLLAALATGCKGAVGSTYNYAAPLYKALIESFNSGNLPEARKLQAKSVEIVGLLGKYGGMATGKAFMRYIGLDCGKFRLPVKNMTEAEYSDFASDVRSLGLDELMSK
ncbi:MAG: dihydrodipicolinate synthase family protein [Bacteroidales bacterium]